MPKWLEFLAFQVVWFACVLGAANDAGWIGCAAAAAFVVAVARRAPTGPGIFSLACAACIAGLVGSAADAWARQRGWIVYRGDPIFEVWAPAWIVALWVAFAATLSSSLAWLRGRAWLSVPFAAIGAPLSYVGASRLGAVEFDWTSWPAVVGISASWIAALHAAQWIEARLRVSAPHVSRTSGEGRVS